MRKIDDKAIRNETSKAALMTTLLLHLIKLGITLISIMQNRIPAKNPRLILELIQPPQAAISAAI